jgi:hypothetical protein
MATMTTLKAIPADRRVAGMLALVVADGSLWRFHASSALTGDDILVAAPGAGSGRWLRMPGATTLVMPFTFATADAAALLTIPTGCAVYLEEIWWEVTANFTGGSSSAIGVSSAKTNFSTKGDLLGGAGGSEAAALTAAGSPNFGTIGAAFDTLAKRRPALWVAGDIIRHDRITSAFTAGTGNVVAKVNIRKNDGA